MKYGPKPKFDVFERIESVKTMLEPLVPDRDSRRVCGLIAACSRYSVGLTKTIEGVERQAYDLLLKNNIRSKTAYEWFLLEHVPPHIKAKVVGREIGVREATRQFVIWKRMSNMRFSTELMGDIRDIVGRLRWKSQE